MVTADAPLLETGSGTVGGTLTSDAIENLPINGRDYTVLARLTVGVVPPQPGARAPLMFSANGVRPAQNNYLLDGIDNNTSNVDFLSGVAYIVKPPVDAVDQIRILTSSFSAEYGRAGGAVLNTTLKSGTNQLRGSFWEFHRNDALNSNDFFANRAGLKKGEYLSNQYGFTAGGPLVGGKTFWFADYEGSVIRQARTWVRSVPTALQRSSGFTDFSDLISLQSGTVGADLLGRTFPRGTVFDPATTREVRVGTGRSRHRQRGDGATGSCAMRSPATAFPTSRLSADAVRLLQSLSRAEPARAEQQLRGQSHEYRQHALVRPAHGPQLERRTIASSRGTASPTTTRSSRRHSRGTATAAGSPKATRPCACMASPRATCTCSVRRSSTRRESASAASTPTGCRPMARTRATCRADTASQGIPQLVGNGGLPTLQLSGLSDLGHAGWVVSERFSNTLQFSDNLTKVYKSHTFKTGYTFQDIFFGSTQPPYARGQYNWDGRYTSMVNQIDNTTSRVHAVLRQIPSNGARRRRLSAADCRRFASRRSATSTRSRPIMARMRRTAGG